LVPLGVGFENFTYFEEVVFQTITLISLVIIIYTLEKLFWIQIKHLLSILVTSYLIIVTLIGIFSGINIVEAPFNTLNTPIVTFLPFFYLYLAIKGSPAIRKSSLFFFLGFGSSIFMGGVLRYQTIDQFIMPIITPENELIFHLLSPISLMVGGLLILVGFLKIKNYFYLPIESIHIFMKRSGVPIFEHFFKSKGKSSLLVTGGIFGMTHLIKEITKKQTQIKEIKQKDMNIILEYGLKIGVAMLSRENLRILRGKLKGFVNQFETQYENELNNWAGNIEPFKSCVNLVYQTFEFSLIEEI